MGGSDGDLGLVTEGLAFGRLPRVPFAVGIRERDAGAQNVGTVNHDLVRAVVMELEALRRTQVEDCLLGKRE